MTTATFQISFLLYKEPGNFTKLRTRTTSVKLKCKTIWPGKQRNLCKAASDGNNNRNKTTVT